MSTEETEKVLGRLLVELQALRGTANTLQSRINLIDAALSELELANASLGGLKNSKKGASLLFPIGGGSYIKARLEDAEKVIVGIGAGVASEKTYDKAQENIGTRVAEIQRSRVALQQRLSQVVEQINETEDRVNEIVKSREAKDVVRKT
mgnify:CR=1 FL=1